MIEEENVEDSDWIFVCDGVDEFAIKKNLKCDLCERHIPSLILCKDCKTNKRCIYEKEQCGGMCDFCEKEVKSLFQCETCQMKLCMDCKFGDDLMPKGVNCCEIVALRNMEKTRLEIEKMENATEPIENGMLQDNFGQSPLLRTEHQKLFKEFLELR